MYVMMLDDPAVACQSSQSLLLHGWRLEIRSTFPGTVYFSETTWLAPGRGRARPISSGMGKLLAVV